MLQQQAVQPLNLQGLVHDFITCRQGLPGAPMSNKHAKSSQESPAPPKETPQGLSGIWVRTPAARGSNPAKTGDRALLHQHSAAPRPCHILNTGSTSGLVRGRC